MRHSLSIQTRVGSYETHPVAGSPFFFIQNLQLQVSEQNGHLERSQPPAGDPPSKYLLKMIFDSVRMLLPLGVGSVVWRAAPDFIDITLVPVPQTGFAVFVHAALALRALISALHKI